MKLHPQEDAGLIETTLVTCVHCKDINIAPTGNTKLCDRCEFLVGVLGGNQPVEVPDDILTKDTTN